MADVPDSGDQPPAAAGEDGPGLTQRASDADRDRAVTQLRDHVVEGRLTLDEFSERVGRTLEARTQGDLVAVMRDLPVPAPSAPVAAGAPTATPVSARKKRRWHVAILSGHKTRGRWRISGQTNAVAVLGGCDMDLRRAEIEGPEVVITAFAFLGGIDITVPEGFDVDLQGFSFLGGRDLKLRDVPRVPGSPLIVVRGFAFLGGIDVKSRPNRTKRQLARAAAAAGLADPDDDDEDQPSGLLIPPVMPAPPLPTTPTPPPPMPTPPMSTPAPMSTSTSTPSPATPTAPWQTPPSSATPPPAQATPAQPPSDLADVTSDVATDGTVTI
ncbi:MAG TPA: DUF1707 domain-containing protein, partial [Acidimicrobiales bacterium]|nr:DUF1707 domain-containing protein [Acidimicrobiales bacterium]